MPLESTITFGSVASIASLPDLPLESDRNEGRVDTQTGDEQVEEYQK